MYLEINIEKERVETNKQTEGDRYVETWTGREKQ